MNLPRAVAPSLLDDLAYTPVVGLLGPRQVGKSTLARVIAETRPSDYFDLQRPSDRQQLERAELVLPPLADRLVVVDEVQLLPELFGWLRPLIDEARRPGRFLLLGSAAPSLIRGASESLAGRIAYTELTPLSLPEVRPAGIDLPAHHLTGGYPEPLLQLPPRRRGTWFKSFLRTYVTRDLTELGAEVVPGEYERLLSMLAFAQGGLFNASELSRSLTVTHHTVHRYVDLLERSFLVRRLLPYLPSLRKRLVKSPRIYVRDTGLLHYLIGISDYRTLLGHPVAGRSWEGYVIEEVCRVVGDRARAYFYRTGGGAELDLVLDFRSHVLAFECKLSDAPKLTKGFYQAVADVSPERTYVVTPSARRHEHAPGVEVLSLSELLSTLAA